MLEKTFESPLYCKEIQPAHPKADQSWVFVGRTDVEAETPILWPPDAKRWLIWKDPDAGKDWGRGEKGTREDEMVGWHHRHNGHVFGQTPEVGDRQGGLVCSGSWGRKESDMTERLNWTEEESQRYPITQRPASLNPLTSVLLLLFLTHDIRNFIHDIHVRNECCVWYSLCLAL